MCDCKSDYKAMILELKKLKELEDHKQEKFCDYIFITCDFCNSGYIEYPGIRKCPNCLKWICSTCDKEYISEYDFTKICLCKTTKSIKCQMCLFHYCDECKTNKCEDCDKEDFTECPKCIKNINEIYLCDSHIMIRSFM